MKRNLFFWIISLCLIINLVSDYFLFRQNRVELLISEWVSQSYGILRQVDGIRIQILEARLQNSQTLSLTSDLQELGTLTEEMPEQRARVQKLQQVPNDRLLATAGEVLIPLIDDIEASEEKSLIDHVHRDEQSIETSDRLILFANGVDLLLLFSAIGLFLLERKNARRTEIALTKGLAQVEQVNQELQANLLNKESQFKQTVGQLKVPLDSILNMAEMMGSETKAEFPLLKLSQLIQQVSASTLSMVGSVLEVEVNGPAVKENMSLRKILNRACGFMIPVAFKKGQFIDLDSDSIDGIFYGLVSDVEKIFLEILQNAVRFSPAQGEVQVSTSTLDGFFQVNIKDRGPGFNTADFEHLLTEKQPEKDSTSFGLLSVKQNIQNLGGALEIANNRGGGSCVTLLFPLVT